MAGPLANNLTQLVGLFLQLTHPLRLDGEITTEFLDLTFDHIRPRRGSKWPTLREALAPADFGIDTLLPLILTGGRVGVCTVWNEIAAFSAFVEHDVHLRPVQSGTAPFVQLSHDCLEV